QTAQILSLEVVFGKMIALSYPSTPSSVKESSLLTNLVEPSSRIDTRSTTIGGSCRNSPKVARPENSATIRLASTSLSYDSFKVEHRWIRTPEPVIVKAESKVTIEPEIPTILFVSSALRVTTLTMSPILKKDASFVNPVPTVIFGL